MSTDPIDDEAFEQLAKDLEYWLANQATAGVPASRLAGLLYGYAEAIEDHGSIPQS